MFCILLFEELLLRIDWHEYTWQEFLESVTQYTAHLAS